MFQHCIVHYVYVCFCFFLRFLLHINTPLWSLCYASFTGLLIAFTLTYRPHYPCCLITQLFRRTHYPHRRSHSSLSRPRSALTPPSLAFTVALPTLCSRHECIPQWHSRFLLGCERHDQIWNGRVYQQDDRWDADCKCPC